MMRFGNGRGDEISDAVGLEDAWQMRWHFW